jgi:hypothetical protein
MSNTSKDEQITIIDGCKLWESPKKSSNGCFYYSFSRSKCKSLVYNKTEYFSTNFLEFVFANFISHNSVTVLIR